MSEVSCLMTGYKRPHTIEAQYKAIQSQTVKPAKIAIWHNFGAVDVNQKLINSIPNVQSSNTNWGVWSRFLLCMEFTTEYVCIFDDDTIPGPRWFESCLEHMKQREGLYGACGAYFSQAKRTIRNDDARTWYGPASGHAEVAMVDIVGHAWFFKRDWLRYYGAEPRISRFDTGEDYHFAVAIQKHLGLPCLVPPYPEFDKSVWGSTQFNLGQDANAQWRIAGAKRRRITLHNKHVTNGWQPMVLRGASVF